MTNPFAKNPLPTEDAEEENVEAQEDLKETKAHDADTKEAQEEKAAKSKEDEVSSEPKKDTKKDDKKVSESSKSAKTPKRKTPTQERDELKEKVAELEAKLASKADKADIQVVRDEVLSEDGPGGVTRLVGGGKTLVNDNWRLTVDGLRVLVGRSSTQATTHFQIPVSLVESLQDLLTHIEKIER